MLCHSISASLLSFDIGISSQTSSQRRNLSFDHLFYGYDPPLLTSGRFVWAMSLLSPWHIPSSDKLFSSSQHRFLITNLF